MLMGHVYTKSHTVSMQFGGLYAGVLWLTVSRSSSQHSPLLLFSIALWTSLDNIVSFG